VPRYRRYVAHRALDDELDALIAGAIERGVCSAGAIAVGDAGREIARLGRGWTRTIPDRGDPCGDDAIYDLASLTKPIATAAIAMRLVARGALGLDDGVASHGLAMDDRVNVAHLLGHASGLPPHIKFYERLRTGDFGGAPSARAGLIALAAAQPLEAAPGTRTAYSDLGYALAGAVVERAGNAPLEDLFAREIAAPLGLAATRFVDLTRPRAPWPAPVVATEQDDRGLNAGEVHDENAHAAGGVCGHAGLFGPVADVSRFARAIVDAAAGDATTFAPAVVETFLTRRAAPDSSWRLGWDTPSHTPGASTAGDRWPRAGAVGHLGYTGTSMWLDLPRRRWVVLLTNRVHPHRDRAEAALIKDLRRAVHDAVVIALDRA
jgi:CubicO group peptidase (beta-lactamase class C family)